MRIVILLRGVNVGGKNLLPMDALREQLRSLGATAVRTYIQSGNAVVDHDDPSALPAALQAELRARFGLDVPVVTRDAASFCLAAARHPLAEVGDSPQALHLMFLADPPRPDAALDPHRSPPDTFEVVGREVYLRCPNGLGRSRLTNAWFDAALGTVSTTRNWDTVQTLAAWASEP